MTDEQVLPFVESDAAASAESLRAKMTEQGYVFFRHIVPEDVIFDVRRQILALQQDAGWIDTESHDLMEGVVRNGVAPTMEGKADYTAVYRKVLKLPAFHALPEHPALMQVASKLLDDP